MWETWFHLKPGELTTPEGGTPALLKGGQPGTQAAETTIQRVQHDHTGVQHLTRCTAGTAGGTGFASTGADAAFNSFQPSGTPQTQILRPGSIAQIPEQILNPDARCPFLCIPTCPQPSVVSNLVNILEKHAFFFFFFFFLFFFF